jgi:hypothetical protein
LRIPSGTPRQSLLLGQMFGRSATVAHCCIQLNTLGAVRITTLGDCSLPCSGDR